MTIKPWTEYFLDLAKTCASRSNCIRANVGAVIVGDDKKIKATGFSDAEKVIFSGDLNLYQMKSEPEKFLNLAYSGLNKYYSGDYTMLNRMARYFLQITTEQKYLEKAADWAKQSISLKSTAENNDTYASLVFKLGNKSEAVKFEKEALELAKKEKITLKGYEDKLKKFQE